MARSSTTETYQSSNSTSKEHSKTDSRQDTTSQSTSNSRQDSTSQSSSTSQSTSKNVLDKELMNQILSGLMGTMTDEQITQFAENLLRPQLNAGLEEAQQNYETTKLSKEQEIANIAANLTRSIDEQNAAYRRSAANVETAALNRGMGRSSYTMQTLANQGDALAKAVQQLTEDSGRRSQQIQNQITQAAQQNSQTQGRLSSDYASQLAAKVQELKENQRKEWNSNYLTAISSAMGQQTTGSQQTAGSQTSIRSHDGKPTDAWNERNDGRKQHGEQRNERIDDDEQGRRNEQKEGNGKQSGGKHTRNLWTIQPEEHEQNSVTSGRIDAHKKGCGL